MVLTLLQFDFSWKGPWGSDLETACRDLATDIAGERGLIWKIWTESEKEGRAGGIYLFTDAALAEQYAHKHKERLAAFGVKETRALVLSVNEGLSLSTRAHLT